MLRVEPVSPPVPGNDGPGAAAVDVTATRDPETGAMTVFAVNRHEQEHGQLEISLVTDEDLHVVEHLVLGGVDLMLTNSRRQPDQVAPRTSSQHTLADSRLTVVLPPVSWSVLRLEPAAER